MSSRHSPTTILIRHYCKCGEKKKHMNVFITTVTPEKRNLFYYLKNYLLIWHLLRSEMMFHINSEWIWRFFFKIKAERWTVLGLVCLYSSHELLFCGNLESNRFELGCLFIVMLFIWLKSAINELNPNPVVVTQ